MSNIIPIKGLRTAPKSVRSTMETSIFSVKEIVSWILPPFQRPLRVNEKVRSLAEELKQNGGSITGVITLGKVGDSATIYIVDGQHRLEGFKISGLAEIIVDLRMCHFDSMAEMADEFVRLNSSLVRMRPDDVLRGLEASVKGLRAIRKDCEFVGYDNIRRSSTSSPVLSMSAVLRCWSGSSGDTPTGHANGQSATQVAEALDDTSVDKIVLFLLTAHAAWGRDPEYYRLWGNLNLTLCMWIWRRLVLDHDRTNKRVVALTVAQFKQCLMSLSSKGDYLDWLQGRVLSDRDRSPCYGHIKKIFVARLSADSKDQSKKPVMPAPPWASK